MIIDARDKNVRTGQDNKTTLQAACNTARTYGMTLWIPPGTYPLSGMVDLTGYSGLKVEGVPGQTIFTYPSGDTSIVGTGGLSDAMARSALLVKQAAGVTLRGLTFVGQQGFNIDNNIGKGVYATEATDLVLDLCASQHGGGLLTQDATSTDIGLRVSRCSIYASRLPMNPGNRAVISGCRFEQPTSSSFDRTDGVTGSSHGIYIYAGRESVTVEDCHFKNIRVDGVKGSGTSLPVRGLVVKGCHFDDCASGVLFGADGATDEEHSGLVVTGNVFTNCATNRFGWNQGAAVNFLGSRGIVISGNVFNFDRNNLSSVGSCNAISGGRYNGTARAVQQVIITDNAINVRCESGFATTPDAVLNAGVSVWDIGPGGDNLGACRIAGNLIEACNTGIVGTGCVGLSIEENTFVNCVLAVQTSTCTAPIVRRNRIVVGPNTTSGTRYSSTSDTGAVYTDNL